MEQKLLKKALLTIEANIQNTEQGSFVVAGAHQFRTLWVRDFCFSVPGLLYAGKADLVERQLRLIHSFKRADGQLPRGIDVCDPKTRVLRNTIFGFLPKKRINSYHGPLLPEYLGEHLTPAFDSNLLFLRSLCELANFTKQKLILNQEEIASLLAAFDPHWKEGLLFQPAFSDWQDSARRSGSLLLTQLLYLDALSRLEKLGIQTPSHARAKALEEKVLQFFDPAQKLFREQLGNVQISLDSHCLILSSPQILLSVNRAELYAALKNHPLWQKGLVPGIPVYPYHAASSVSWTTKIAGLRHYHDGFYWGWLVADALKITALQGDAEERARILTSYANSTDADPYLAEIYESDQDKLFPVERLFYKSEAPFTWSAAKWVEALNTKA